MLAGTSTIWWFMEYKITVDLDNLIDEAEKTLDIPIVGFKRD